METILVTGAAGFIGYHLAKRLLKDGYNVIGVDNLNDYYDVNLKYGRLNDLGISKEKVNYDLKEDHNVNNFTFYKLDISDTTSVVSLFEKFRFDYVVHLAAQAGVRYSLENPRIYLSSNVDGTLNILEGVKLQRPKHLIYASSSSVYGMSETFPLSETDETSKPVSLYAATKKTTELLAYTYSHLYNLKTTGLRFFTVYGPWARPDMALSIFAEAITNNKPITLYNHGNMLRDFTYVDDIIESIVRVMTKTDTQDSGFGTSHAAKTIRTITSLISATLNL